MRNGLYVFDKSSLSYQRVSFLKVFSIPIIVLFLLGSFFGATTADPTVIEKLTEVEKLIVINESTKFTKERLQVEIGNFNFKFPEIVYAQAIIETGNFTSVIFKESHNMFGMKLAKLRPTTAVGESRGHAEYYNWIDSLHDYGIYYAKYLMDLNEEEYYAFLSKYYAEDPNYVKKVRRLAEKYKKQKLFWHFKDSGGPWDH